MANHARTLVVVAALLLLLPSAISADAFCQLCFTTYRAPGGADSDSVGIFRLDGCPACQREDCKTAAQRALGMRNHYKALREQYEQLSKQIADLRAGGHQVPNSKLKQQADMNVALGCQELHYAILNASCPKEVPGEDVWDGLYAGPVENSPVSAVTEAERAARLANQAAGSYDRMSESEQQQIDVISGFFGATADGFTPPESGYNGERYRSTKSFSHAGGAYRQEAQNMTQGRAGKPDPKADLKKAIVPTFPEIKVAKGGEEHIRNAGIAARARSEGNTYIVAFLQAREMHRQSLAAGNQEAAKMHARSAVEFAFQAKGYAEWAADHQHKSDVVHQRLLDESLAAAATKGLTLAVLLEKFQSQLKTSGLPAHLRDALTAAGANAEELAGAKERLLALTPEAVEAVLKERRARIARGPEVPDASILDLQLLASRQTHHKLDNK